MLKYYVSVQSRVKMTLGHLNSLESVGDLKMLNETNQPTVTHILSDAAQKAYEKIKALILKIFSLLKHQKGEKDLKDHFYDSYIDFARKLDMEGYKRESVSYMAICEMYYRLMDRPDELIAHESFFMDLFKSFEDILWIRINEPDEYDEKFDDFLVYRGKMQEYYYRNLAVPSSHYDEKTLNEITSYLSGDL